MVGEVSFGRQLSNLHRLDRYAVEIAILLALLVLMMFTTGNPDKRIFLLLYTLFVLVLMVHVSLDGFLKNRVFLCMIVPILITDFMLLPDTTGRKRRWGITIALLGLSGWYGYQIYTERLTAEYNRSVWTRLQQPLLEYVPQEAYVTTIGTSMMMESTDPWHVWPYDFHKYTLGWTTYLPLNKPVGHSYRALLRDDMYIFTDRRYDREHTALQRVCEEIDKHYSVPVEIIWKVRNGRYAVVQLKVKS